jgi:hypothetical protein
MLIHKNALLILTLACVGYCLSGCGAALQKWEGSNSFMVAAEPLCEATPGKVWAGDGRCVAAGSADDLTVLAKANSNFQNKEYLGRVITESEYNCGAFLNGLTLASNTTSTTLDGLTTVFSALGTVFTPLLTVHALTAGASISSGWNNVIRSDIYAQRTVENYAQAIQSTYYDAIQKYNVALGIADENTIVLSSEIAQITAIHRSCTLPSAQGTITTALQSGNSDTTSPQTTTTIDVTGDAVKNDTFTLTGTGGLVVSYTASGTVPAASVASTLILQILAPTSKFATAGVTAAPVPGKASFTVRSPTNVQWQVSGKLKVEPAASAGAAPTGGVAPVAGGPASPGSGQPPSNSTSVTNRITSPGAAPR